MRTLCITRETLARHDGLADFAFAMQGLGTGAISLFGTPEQQQLAGEDARRQGDLRLRAVRAALRLRCRQHGHDRHDATATTMCCHGEKTWISNGGIADLYVVFARTGEAPGAKGISAFLVPADAKGLTIAERSR